MLPNQVHNKLHITDTGCNRKYGILVWHYNTKLAGSTISTVYVMPATPELITVSLIPIIVGITAV